DFVNILVANAGKTRSAANGEVNSAIERLRRLDLDVRGLQGDYVPGDWSVDALESEGWGAAAVRGPRETAEKETAG
ncbi:MAG: hypothetical protein RXQ97_06345, partial [Caldivirga sp.]